MIIMDNYLQSFAEFLCEKFNDNQLDDTSYVCDNLAQMVLNTPEEFKPVFEEDWISIKDVIRNILPEFIIYFYKFIEIDAPLAPILLCYPKNSFGNNAYSLNNDLVEIDYSNSYKLTKENLDGLEQIYFLRWHFNEIDLNEGMKVFWCENCGKVSKINFNKGLSNTIIKECRSLNNIALPEGYTELTTYTISLNFNLKEITLPSSITKLDDYCICNCNNLTTINYNGTMADWKNLIKGTYYMGRFKLNAPVKKILCRDGFINYI